MEAWQVPLEKTFFKRLETKLGVEVIAMGASGHGSFHAMQKLVEPGLQYSPDLVIAFLTDQNDFKDDLFLLKKQAEKKPARPASLLPNQDILDEMRLYERLSVVPRSYLNRWAAFHAVMAVRQRRTDTENAERFRSDMAVFLKADSALLREQRQTWQNIVNATAMNHVRMKRLCEDRGIRFMTVFIDNPFSYDPKRAEALYKLVPEFRGQMNFAEPRNTVKKILSANGVEFVDLNEGFSFSFRKRGTAFHYRYDPHWNEAGHALTAEILAEALQKILQ